eukprot:35265_1
MSMCGAKQYTTLQILDLDTLQWMNNTPSLNTPEFNTGLVTVSTDLMSYPISHTSPIIADAVLYTFGGIRDAETEGSLVKNRQYYIYDLSTASPTWNPSALNRRPKSPTHTGTPSKSTNYRNIWWFQSIVTHNIM